jgi:hypothetical protein
MLAMQWGVVGFLLVFAVVFLLGLAWLNKVASRVRGPGGRRGRGRGAGARPDSY